MLKLVGDKQDIDIVLKYLSTNCFIIKGKWELTVEEPGGHHLNQGSRLLFLDKALSHPCQHNVLKGHSITSVICKLKVHDLNPIVRKHYTSPNWEVIYKTDLYSSKMWRLCKTKAEEIFQLKGCRDMKTKCNV